jgi:hypothetical protein
VHALGRNEEASVLKADTARRRTLREEKEHDSPH